MGRTKEGNIKLVKLSNNNLDLDFLGFWHKIDSRWLQNRDH
ncbi:hypothetical protein H1P_620002 [Hyella patelloides LEGE 07179]|uniref:Uncharacterized protein n=1 Tax=Hyella patelloides LEGE 07179 TaxID=945734 RepID=A0A563W1T2_9CYAN|nr:hypothetical protein H1P_620002 [Hyella patelloides LEGE 07179]